MYTDEDVKGLEWAWKHTADQARSTVVHQVKRVIAREIREARIAIDVNEMDILKTRLNNMEHFINNLNPERE